MPGFIEPCDPTLHERAPVGTDWVYEIKTDGYRAQVHIHNKRVTIYSRSGYDWTNEFAPIGWSNRQVPDKRPAPQPSVDQFARAPGFNGITLLPNGQSPVGKSTSSTLAASSAIVNGFFRTRFSEGSSFVGPTYPVI